mgnify:CR=1 FL=1
MYVRIIKLIWKKNIIMGLFSPDIEKLKEKGQIDKITKALEHRNADVRLKAFDVLKDYVENPDMIIQLKSLLYDSEPKVCLAAVSFFTKFQDDEALKRLRPVILQGSQNDVIDALRLIASRTKEFDSEIANLVLLALQDKKTIIQMEAIRTMGYLKGKLFFQHILPFLNSNKFPLRLEAAKALGAIGTEDSVDALIGLLLDSHREVRGAAREALKSLDMDKAQLALNDAPFQLLIKRMSSDVASREETINYIGKQRLKEGLPLLHKACNDEYKSVRIAAIKALGQIKDHRSIDYLGECLNDTYFDIRLEVLKSLEKLLSPKALAYIKMAVEDKNWHVREYANQAVYSLEERLEKAGE